MKNEMLQMMRKEYKRKKQELKEFKEKIKRLYY